MRHATSQPDCKSALFEAISNAFQVRTVSADRHFSLQQLHVFPEIDSTMTKARELVQSNAHRSSPDITKPLIVFASSQTKGRGRQDRVWHSPPERGIYVTYVLPTKLAANALGPFSLSAGVATARALRACGADISLKWPNDIVWVDSPGGFRKLGGILTELITDISSSNVVLLGIGLNIFPAPYPADIPAVSLADIIGQELDSARVFGELSAEVLIAAEQFFDSGFAPFRAEWESKAITSGRMVRLLQHKNVLTGKVLGITDHGALRVEIGDKAEHLAYSGDIELL